MTKEELKSELDEVISEIGDILDTLYKFDEKLYNLYLVKKVTCNDICYKSCEDNRICRAGSGEISICYEDGYLKKIIFGKIREIEYFTKEDRDEFSTTKVNVEDLNKRKLILEEKEKELRRKIYDLEMIEYHECNQKTSFLCKIWGYFKI